MYVAVKGGERAIENAHRLLAHERRGDRDVPEVSLDQISEQLALGVDRVMAEGSLYDRELAALAVKQARGDLIEAIFLVRAFHHDAILHNTRAGIHVPKDLEGRLIATHQGVHAIHKYLLRRVYGLDDEKLRWESYPQEKLLGVLENGEADAVVLLDQFFFRGEVAPGVRCLYTDGEAWQKLTGFDEMIKHMVAAREDLLRDHPGIKDVLLRALRQSFAYSEAHLAEIADVFLSRYDGDREALLASARYPRIEFTFSEREQKLAQEEMQLLVDVGQLPRTAPIASLFAA